MLTANKFSNYLIASPNSRQGGSRVHSGTMSYVAWDFLSMSRLFTCATALGIAALLAASIVAAIISLKLSGALGLAPPHEDEE